MIFLSAEIDNIYMFFDFKMNLITDSKNENTILKNESLIFAPKIRYKKINIIMGGNASGKTTFGKLLNGLHGFLMGRVGSFFDKKYHKDEKSYASLIFVVNEYLFKYSIIFDEDKFIEKIKHIKLSADYDMNKSMSLLKEQEYKVYKSSLNIDSRKKIPAISAASIKYEICEKTLGEFIREDSNYYFRFTDSLDENLDENLEQDYFLSYLDDYLKIIDDSVESVSKVLTIDIKSNSKKYENDYHIGFKNGEGIFVEKGDISNLKDKRLSRGTIEAIEIAHLLSMISHYKGIIYLDEQMAYMHTKLSNALIIKLIESISDKSQIFITTHDENVLNLNIPLYSYTFMVRENGKIRVVNPEENFIASRNKLIEYVQNDYFDTNPDLDALWDI